MSHYKPKPHYRTADASKHCHALMAALEPWIQQAMTGQKRHRIASPHTQAINRAADDLVCDCAAVLSESVEWEGALLAAGLAGRGWPVDVELVRACHTWSCSLMDKIMAAHRARPANLRGAA